VIELIEEEKRPQRLLTVDSNLEFQAALRDELNSVKFPAEAGESTRFEIELGPQTYQCLASPLSARGEIVGSIAFGTLLSNARFGSEDLVFVEDLGRAIGLAIHNAWLVQKLKRVNEARAELVAIVSHELKHPLTAIKLNANLLHRFVSSEDATKDDLRERLKVIDQPIQQLERLTADLLDSQKIEFHKISLKFEKVSAVEIANEVSEMYSPTAAEKEIRFAVSCEKGLPDLQCDRARILQVLSNFLSNAFKFTPRRGQVSFRVGLETARELRFEVEDTGHGISTDQITQAFDRYWQAADASHQGSGLGLYIAKGIVNAHHGRLGAEKNTGLGSKFFFTLPLQPLQ
jgi:signal transduction histidine kinase